MGLGVEVLGDGSCPADCADDEVEFEVGFRDFECVCEALAGEEDIPEEAFQDLQLKANLEYWIEPLKEITFDTALAPISVADANLLIRCYEHYEQGAGQDGAELPTADAEALAALEATLAECMASLNAGEGARFFVKDSSRGPKDFGLISDEFVAQFTAAVRASSGGAMRA